MPTKKELFDFKIQSITKTSNTTEREALLNQSLDIYDNIIQILDSLEIEKTWPDAYQIIGNHLHELIKNCVDSFIAISEQHNDSFDGKIKVVVSTNDNTFTFKIKDNGKGFNSIPKQEMRNTNKDTIEQLRSLEDKNPNIYLGGQKLGLFNLSKEIQNKNGVMLIKNRKDKGASVILEFKKK